MMQLTIRINKPTVLNEIVINSNIRKICFFVKYSLIAILRINLD